MLVRMPTVAGAFYPLQESACREQVRSYLEQVKLPASVVSAWGGLVPHAGWVYSGGTAAHVYAVLQRSSVDTVVLLGAVHHWGVTSPAAYPAGAWRTPLGDVTVDDELSEAVVAVSQGVIKSDARAHASEHSIEVQLPFVQMTAPQAKILPIAVPPEPAALEVGSYLAQAVTQTKRRVFVVASSDLTHYGPRYGFAPAGVGERGLEWSRSNDAHLLDLVISLQAEAVLQTAERQRSACGGGAIASAIVCTKALGATQGVLLHYTTSYDVLPSGHPTELVGYGAVAFC